MKKRIHKQLHSGGSRRVKYVIITQGSSPSRHDYFQS